MFYAFLGQIGTHSFLAKVCATYVYHKLSISTLLIIIDIVISVFLKGDGKGSAHGWVPSIAVVTAASNVLLKIFDAAVTTAMLGTHPCALPLRSEEHTSELQSLRHLVCRLLLEKK